LFLPITNNKVPPSPCEILVKGYPPRTFLGEKIEIFGQKITSYSAPRDFHKKRTTMEIKNETKQLIERNKKACYDH